MTSLSSSFILHSTSSLEKERVKTKGHKISRSKPINWYIVGTTLASWQQKNISRNNKIIRKECKGNDIVSFYTIKKCILIVSLYQVLHSFTIIIFVAKHDLQSDCYLQVLWKCDGFNYKTERKKAVNVQQL